MNKTKFIIPAAMASLLAIGSLSGCSCDGEKKDERLFGFSVSLLSGKNTIELGTEGEKLVVSDNGVKTDGRSYEFKSDNPEVATVNSDGTIIPRSVGKVNFSCKELSEGMSSTLPYTVNIVEHSENQEGGFNFSAQGDSKRRTQILASLEKYAMDKKLTGITLFDNGGYVQYSSRVHLGSPNYITGYGFGLLREGYLQGEPLKDGITEPTFYHSAISQDPLTINAMNASGSQVSDLSSYITSAYWGTKMNITKDGYDWYPILASDKVYRPTFDKDENVTFASELSENLEPIPREVENPLKLYKKWRIYLKVGTSDNDDVQKTDKLAYRYAGSAAAKALPELANLDGRKVALEDYEYAYKFILTGKNGQSRGAEMAGDTTYGIKGAQKYFNATRTVTTEKQVNDAWNDFLAGGGLKVGVDDKHQPYIDFELVNAIDSFTAMYSLSSNLVSPMPEDFIEGIGKFDPKGIQQPTDVPMFLAAEKIGAFNNGTGSDNILDYTINCGPYYLSNWVKRKQIIFTRNDNWFECDGSVYRIPGIVNDVIDTSTDAEAIWKQFKDDKALDVAGVPTSKTESEGSKSLVTKGDSTFKLNVNSCTQEQWDYYNEHIESWKNNGRVWDVKPWMSNMNFLNGLFFSINRKEFADKRGVQPSINYFSDAYQTIEYDDLGNRTFTSYNETAAHKEAVSNYHTVRDGVDNHGYDYDKAVSYFRTAVAELVKTNPDRIAYGSVDNPFVIHIHIRWMYQTDIKEYGEDIKHYFETAFNDPAVCGGTIKLVVDQEAVTNWEDVYDQWMMKGKYDLAFGAISGNTLNPLNFLEVLKSDNSSTFTLNYGANTALVDETHPIVFENKKWSFDALWESADHGGIVKNGVNIKPIEKCYRGLDYMSKDNPEVAIELTDGYYTEIPVKFANVAGVNYDFSRLECYIPGYGYHTFKNAKLNDAKDHIILEVDAEEAAEINTILYQTFVEDDPTSWHNSHPSWDVNKPFRSDAYGDLYSYEFYFKMKLSELAPLTETYCEVKKSQRDA